MAENLAARRAAWEPSSVRRSLIHQLTFCAAFVTAPALSSAQSVGLQGSVRARSAASEPSVIEKLAVASRVSRGKVSSKPGREAHARPTVNDSRGRDHSVNAVQSALPIQRNQARHSVASGETLSHLAVRYDTSVAKIAALNDLDPEKPLRLGQVLVLPASASQPPKSWHPYAKPSKKSGYLEVSTHASRFQGLTVDADGRLRTPAVRALNNLLGAGGPHPPLPERLIRLLIQVSDTFGGRGLRVVSGYRTRSFFQDSRHKVSCAVDFSVIGVPNAVLRDYLREFEDVG
ncbi:MAG TPA: LysM domain-containing protein, partial [Polyangiaceae bacterium]|nr:LysM domain-containing protein [Polyangiaceae bacterium]